MLRYLLDSNIVIYILKQRPIALLSTFNANASAALERLGQPIGVNDLHIAGHARSEGLVLVTNNVSEFTRVAALEVENWVSASK